MTSDEMREVRWQRFVRLSENIDDIYADLRAARGYSGIEARLFSLSAVSALSQYTSSLSHPELIEEIQELTDLGLYYIYDAGGFDEVDEAGEQYERLSNTYQHRSGIYGQTVFDAIVNRDELKAVQLITDLDHAVGHQPRSTFGIVGPLRELQNALVDCINAIIAAERERAADHSQGFVLLP